MEECFFFLLLSYFSDLPYRGCVIGARGVCILFKKTWYTNKKGNIKKKMGKEIIRGLKRALGQNFLINEIVAVSIVEYLACDESAILLEIGCGKGALTRFLYQKEYKEYHIVELDDRWAKFITEEYGGRKTGIKIFNQDILDYIPAVGNKYQVIGNVPYNITYLILEKMFSMHEYLGQVVLLVQEEVALKLVKRNGSNYGPISVMTQLLFDISLGLKVGSEEFYPEPKVNSRIIIMKKKSSVLESISIPEFKKFLGYLFSHPRKKIKHQTMPDNLKKRMTAEIPEILEKRAQELSPEEIFSLYISLVESNASNQEKV